MNQTVKLAALAAAVGGGVAFYFQPSPSVVTAPFHIVAYWTGLRGKRLTHATTNENGDIVETPDQLQAAAADVVGRYVSPDAYALARNIHSEEAKADKDTQAAIAWVAVNVANDPNKPLTTFGDIVALLTLCRRASGNGKFGHQSGRWASTASDPYEGDLEVAEAVISGAYPDRTNGAIHYYRPTLQDILFAQGKVTKTADQIAANWGGDGYTVPGVDSGLTFFQAA